MKAALYVRVSSDRQDVDLSVSAQLKALRDYASKNEYEIVREFVDEAESGRTASRTIFKKMISMAKRPEKPFEVILIYKFSRFARSREDSIVFKTMLKKNGVRVVSITEPVDDSSTGKLLEAIIESMDEFYSENLGEEVTRGMRESASRGFYLSSKPPYGYRKIRVQDGVKERTRLEIDERFADIAASIFNDILQGKGLSAIAKSLNQRGIAGPTGKDWQKTGLRSILANEVYTGTLVWGKGSKRNLEPVRVEGACPAIIDKETFDRVQEIIKDRAPSRTHPKVVSSRFLLSGLMRCGHCGKALIGREAKNRQFAYYVCGTLDKKGAGSCEARYINCQKFERMIIERIKEHILNPKQLSELVRLVNEEMDETARTYVNEIETIEHQLENDTRRLERLYDAIETGNINLSDLAPRIQDLRKKQEALLARQGEIRSHLSDRRIRLADIDLVTEYVQDLYDFLNEGSLVQRRSFIKSFVKGIEVKGKNVHMEYTIPLSPQGISEEEMVVLPTVQYGGPGWIRTNDQSVMSRPLYR